MIPCVCIRAKIGETGERGLTIIYAHSVHSSRTFVEKIGVGWRGGGSTSAAGVDVMT